VGGSGGCPTEILGHLPPFCSVDRGLSPVEQYVDGVLCGKIVTGELVRLAVERHLRDLETGSRRGLYFDPDAAQHVLDFCPFLRHYEGRGAGEPFGPSPFQAFVLWNLFGWMREGGFRRFRLSYTQTARKQGKTVWGGGVVGNYMFLADGEAAAQVYSAATKKDQARISHRAAKLMVKRSPHLNSRVEILKDNMSVATTESKFEPLGADADTTDGLNTHCAIVDEIHKHKTRKLHDVIETSMRSRTQPLMFDITTPGAGREGICWELRQYAEDVLRGIVEDDRFFAFVAEPDPGDDYRDETLYTKGNPNLGITVKLEDIRADRKKAEAMPGFFNTFLRDDLGIWTEQKVRAIPMHQWDACDRIPKRKPLRNYVAYGGLDLSSKWDLTAFDLVWPLESGMWPLIPQFWLPEGSMKEYPKREREMYGRWVDEGLIELTPGPIIDYDIIRRRINEYGEEFDIQEIGFDPWNATQLSTQLAGDGFEMVQMRQGFYTMGEPTKYFLALVRAGRLAHGGHKVLRWNANNLELLWDTNGNPRPSKEHERERIDGIAAGIMACGRAMLNLGEDSAYEEAGILTL